MILCKMPCMMEKEEHLCSEHFQYASYVVQLLLNMWLLFSLTQTLLHVHHFLNPCDSIVNIPRAFLFYQYSDQTLRSRIKTTKHASNVLFHSSYHFAGAPNAIIEIFLQFVYNYVNEVYITCSSNKLPFSGSTYIV